MRRRPPRSTLFPSATLFRSGHLALDVTAPPRSPGTGDAGGPSALAAVEQPAEQVAEAAVADVAEQVVDRRPARSEEHTSELQSRQYLVCRLLLEKKKTSTTH